MMVAEEFTIDVPQGVLDDLRQRLENIRWPDRETVRDWSQGAPLDHVRRLVDYWKDDYDWRRCEARLNRLHHCKMDVDGLQLHFIHERSVYPQALPIILTHGWPSSFLEFEKAIPSLVDPVAYGGSAEDAFHVIVPSLPGYGFSERPAETGWTIERTARAWGDLMTALGYSHYVAQGGDWGAAVTDAMASSRLAGLQAVHFSTVIIRRDATQDREANAEDREALDEIADHQRFESAYAAINSTKPQTLGYALADSPVGQAAWIYEKFGRYTNSGRVPEQAFTYDELLDNIMLYWIANSATSAARLYWESLHSFMPASIDLPVGVTLFPHECVKPPRSWVNNRFSNVIHWEKVERGGHFAAKEEPEIFVDQLRRCFRPFRTKG